MIWKIRSDDSDTFLSAIILCKKKDIPAKSAFILIFIAWRELCVNYFSLDSFYADIIASSPA